MAEKDQQIEMFEEEQSEVMEENTAVEPIEEAVEKQEKMITTSRGEQFTETEWKSPVFGDEGPTRQEVEEWKDKYGNIYFTPFEGEIYIWRTLNRAEYREIVSNQKLTVLDREEIFTEKCVLYPRNFKIANLNKGQAGVPTILSEMIMDKSGFVAQTAPIKL